MYCGEVLWLGIVVRRGNREQCERLARYFACFYLSGWTQLKLTVEIREHLGFADLPYLVC
jgi:hypothetical protein